MCVTRVLFPASFFAPPLHYTHSAMDAIKKKMQAMKLEKDNAMDRADACEQQAKDANLRAERVRFFITCISSTIFEENSEKEDLMVKEFDPKI